MITVEIEKKKSMIYLLIALVTQDGNVDYCN